MIIAGPARASLGESVVEINADINYIKREADLSRIRTKPLIRKGWFLGLQALPFLFLAGAYSVRRRREALEADTGLAKRLRARGLAGRRLKTASRALSQEEDDAFYTELASALRGFFGDKLNREAHGLTIEELSDILEKKGLEGEKIQAVCDLLETADAARYAPSSHAKEVMQKHYNQASDIIQDFSKKL